MKTFFLICICLVLDCTVGRLRGCIESDVCESITYNRLVLTDIANEINLLSSNATTELLKSTQELRKATTDMRAHISLSVFDTEILEKCHEENSAIDHQITTLEEEVGSPWQREDNLQMEMTRLQEEKRDLESEMAALQEEFSEVHKKFAEQQEKINYLLKKITRPVDCGDIQALGKTRTGVYKVYPFGNEEEVSVLCDLNSADGAWTVFLKREQSRDALDFNKNWQDYKEGFGRLDKEFWMGNDLLHVMTSTNGPVMLRIDAESFSGDKRYAEWRTFSVGDEGHKYQLTVEGFQPLSTMGDSITESNGMKFTTYDKDNDMRREFNCATGGPGAPLFGKGGWWYSDCGSTRPTSPLLNSNYLNSAYYAKWNPWVNQQMVSMKALTMKFRRSNYKNFFEDNHITC